MMGSVFVHTKSMAFKHISHCDFCFFEAPVSENTVLLCTFVNNYAFGCIVGIFWVGGSWQAQHFKENAKFFQEKMNERDKVSSNFGFMSASFLPSLPYSFLPAPHSLFLSCSFFHNMTVRCLYSIANKINITECIFFHWECNLSFIYILNLSSIKLSMVVMEIIWGFISWTNTGKNMRLKVQRE